MLFEHNKVDYFSSQMTEPRQVKQMTSIWKVKKTKSKQMK